MLWVRAFDMALEYAFNAAQCYAPVETAMKIMEYPLTNFVLSFIYN